HILEQSCDKAYLEKRWKQS
ncbi:hypothetical protein A2U01_0117097, partial [Trifolium medium]|nr:hypothetical protein [Trifolium medium]